MAEETLRGTARAFAITPQQRVNTALPFQIAEQTANRVDPLADLLEGARLGGLLGTISGQRQQRDERKLRMGVAKKELAEAEQFRDILNRSVTVDEATGQLILDPDNVKAGLLQGGLGEKALSFERAEQDRAQKLAQEELKIREAVAGLQKTQAETGAVQALEAQRRRPVQPKSPTKASLALAAAGGDPAKAMQMMAPKGFDFQFDRDGRLVSISQGGGKPKPPQRVLSQAFMDVDSAVDTLSLIQDVRQLVQQSPEAASITGDMQLFAANLRDTVTNLATPKSNKDTLVQKRLSEIATADLSQFQLLRSLLEFRLALIGNPDGRISDADIRNAQRALGTGRVIRSARDFLPRLDAFEKRTRRLYDRKSQLLRSLGQEAPPLPEGTLTVETPAQTGAAESPGEPEPLVINSIQQVR